MNAITDKLVEFPRAVHESDAHSVDSREHRLFQALDVHASGAVKVRALLEAFDDIGIDRDDMRLRETTRALQSFSLRDELPGTVMFIFQPAEEGPPPGEEGGT